MVTELKWYDHTADNPPWIKALAGVFPSLSKASYCSDDAVGGVAGPDGDLSCRVARDGLPSLAS